MKKFVKILLVIIIGSLITVIYVNHIQSLKMHEENQILLNEKKEQQEFEKDFKEQQEKIIRELEIENERKLTEQLLKLKIQQAQNFVKSVNERIDHTLLTETGTNIITDDRTPNNNIYTEWLNNSEITIKLDYKAILSIKAESVNYAITQEGVVNAKYDVANINLLAIDIYNVVPENKYGIFGKAYTPIEVIALQNVSKENIASAFYKNLNILKASENLKTYLRKTAEKHGIDEKFIKIFSEGEEILKADLNVVK